MPVNSTSVYLEYNHEISNLVSSYTQCCTAGTIHVLLHVSLDFDMESMGDMQKPDSLARRCGEGLDRSGDNTGHRGVVHDRSIASV